MAISISVSDARRDFAAVVNRVAYGKERVTVVRRGRDLVAIIPMSDVLLLEAIVDELDVTAARSIGGCQWGSSDRLHGSARQTCKIGGGDGRFGGRPTTIRDRDPPKRIAHRTLIAEGGPLAELVDLDPDGVRLAFAHEDLQHPTDHEVIDLGDLALADGRLDLAFEPGPTDPLHLVLLMKDLR